MTPSDFSTDRNEEKDTPDFIAATALEKAPDTLTIHVCPECGRDDRSRPFLGESHFWLGVRCHGRPVDIVYRKESARAPR